MSKTNEKYAIDKNSLLVGKNKIIFDYPIQECIEIDDMLIIYLDLFDKVIPIEQNVFGVSISERKIKWQIEKRKYPNGGNAKMKCSFISITYSENKLYLVNWCSTVLIVDPFTGKVLGQESTK